VTIFLGRCGLTTLLAAAAAGILGAPSAWSESWIVVRARDPNLTFYVDQDSIIEAKSMVTFWEKLIYEKPEQKDEVTDRLIKEKHVHRVMSCAQRAQGFKYGATFAEGGKMIESLVVPDGRVELTPIAPRTVAEEELRLVCNRR
jgi:hypothetical protein